MDPLVIVEKVLEAIVDAVGVEPIVALLASRTSRETAIALLDAQYNLRRAAVDAEAVRELRPATPPPAGKDVP